MTEHILSADHVGQHLGGIAGTTVLRYLWESAGPGRRYSDNPFPAPAGRLGKSPYWLPEQLPQIGAWNANRKGRGVGGGRKPHHP